MLGSGSRVQSWPDRGGCWTLSESLPRSRVTWEGARWRQPLRMGSLQRGLPHEMEAPHQGERPEERGNQQRKLENSRRVSSVACTVQPRSTGGGRKGMGGQKDLSSCFWKPRTAADRCGPKVDTRHVPGGSPRTQRGGGQLCTPPDALHLSLENRFSSRAGGGDPAASLAPLRLVWGRKPSWLKIFEIK